MGKRLLTYNNFCNEDFVFIDKKTLYKLKDYNPPFKIGDEVFIKYNGLTTHLDNIKYEESERTINFIRNNIGKKFIIEELAYEDEQHVWFVNIGEWVYAGSVKLSKPNYNPRNHQDRTIENLNESYYFYEKNEDLGLPYKKEYVTKPLFRIGDKLSFKNDALRINDELGSNYDYYTLGEEGRQYLLKCLQDDQQLIVSQMAYESRLDYWLIQVNHNYFYYQQSLNHYKPTYKPKFKNQRTID